MYDHYHCLLKHNSLCLSRKNTTLSFHVFPFFPNRTFYQPACLPPASQTNQLSHQDSDSWLHACAELGINFHKTHIWLAEVDCDVPPLTQMIYTTTQQCSRFGRILSSKQTAGIRESSAHCFRLQWLWFMAFWLKLYQMCREDSIPVIVIGIVFFQMPASHRIV